MKIVQAPDTVLSTVAKSVSKVDKAIVLLLKNMEEALSKASDPEGVGLAAPQIGKSLQIFVVKEHPEAELKVFINPKIESFKDKPKVKVEKKADTDTVPATKKKKKEKGVQLEGCLSLKDIWGVVKRHDEVTVSYQDEKGAKHTKTFDGFLSVIIQHETDHLNGILFPKRVLEQKTQLYKSIKNKKGETEFEEMEI
ncbi:MAG TPA: peptide deformylase [Candidatus Limnocylindrales bacterium]|nr:peptide deformylase [Candidatus Limnocylindrales bacterium]